MKSSRLRLALFALFPALFLFAGSELGLRLFHFRFQRSLGYMQFAFPSPTELHQVFLLDPLLLWRMKPGYDFGQGYPKLNAQGYRGPDHNLPKKSDGFRIACLGDSVTFGLPTIDYPSALQDRLSRRWPGKKTLALNFGVPGYSSLQGLRLLTSQALEVKPDAVIIFFGWNDHWLVQGFADHEQRVRQNPRLIKFRDSLGRLRTYQALNWAMTLLPRTGKKKLRVADELYRENLLAMIRASRDRGVAVVLCTAPAGFGLGPLPDFFTALDFIGNNAELPPLHRRYNEIVRQVGRRENVPVADLEKIFEERGAKNFFDHPDKDIIHPNAEGQELIAETLTETIVESSGSFGGK